MLEPQDLKAIQAMIEVMFSKQSELIDQRFEEMEARLRQDTITLMETTFATRFDLLMERLDIKDERDEAERIPARVEQLESDTQVLKAAVRRLNEDMQELKAAK